MIRKLILLSVATATLLGAQTLKLNKGWNLKGTSNNIEVSSLDNKCIETVWTFTNNKWKIYSPKESIQEKINNNNDLEMISKIEFNNGFWLKSNEQCQLDLNIGDTQTNYDIPKDTWKLLGSINDIDISKFNNPSVRIVFQYKDDQWFAYSPHEDMQKALDDLAIHKIDTLKSTEGFWIRTYADYSVPLEVKKTLTSVFSTITGIVESTSENKFNRVYIDINLNGMYDIGEPYSKIVDNSYTIEYILEKEKDYLLISDDINNTDEILYTIINNTSTNMDLSTDIMTELTSSMNSKGIYETTQESFLQVLVKYVKGEVSSKILTKSKDDLSLTSDTSVKFVKESKDIVDLSTQTKPAKIGSLVVTKTLKDVDIVEVKSEDIQTIDTGVAAGELNDTDTKYTGEDTTPRVVLNRPIMSPISGQDDKVKVVLGDKSGLGESVTLYITPYDNILEIPQYKELKDKGYQVYIGADISVKGANKKKIPQSEIKDKVISGVILDGHGAELKADAANLSYLYYDGSTWIEDGGVGTEFKSLSSKFRLLPYIIAKKIDTGFTSRSIEITGLDKIKDAVVMAKDTNGTIIDAVEVSGKIVTFKVPSTYDIQYVVVVGENIHKMTRSGKSSIVVSIDDGKADIVSDLKIAGYEIYEDVTPSIKSFTRDDINSISINRYLFEIISLNSTDQSLHDVYINNLNRAMSHDIFDMGLNGKNNNVVYNIDNGTYYIDRQKGLISITFNYGKTIEIYFETSIIKIFIREDIYEGNNIRHNNSTLIYNYSRKDDKDFVDVSFDIYNSSFDSKIYKGVGVYNIDLINHNTNLINIIYAKDESLCESKTTDSFDIEYKDTMVNIDNITNTISFTSKFYNGVYGYISIDNMSYADSKSFTIESLPKDAVVIKDPSYATNWNIVCDVMKKDQDTVLLVSKYIIQRDISNINLKGTTIVFDPSVRRSPTHEDQTYTVKATITKGNAVRVVEFEETIKANKDKKAVYDAVVEFDKLSQNHRDYINDDVIIVYDITKPKKATAYTQSYTVKVTFISNNESKSTKYTEIIDYDVEIQQEDVDNIKKLISSRELPKDLNDTTIVFDPVFEKYSTYEDQTYTVTVTITKGEASAIVTFEETVKANINKKNVYDAKVEFDKLSENYRDYKNENVTITFNPSSIKNKTYYTQIYTVTVLFKSANETSVSTFEESVEYDEKLKTEFEVNSIKNLINSRELPEDLKGTTVVFDPISKKEAIFLDQTYIVTATITKGDSKATRTFYETVKADINKKNVYDAKVEFDKLNINYRDYTNENVDISYDIKTFKKVSAEDQSYQVTVTFKSGDESSISTYNEFVKADPDLVAQAILDKIAASITGRDINAIDLKGASVVFDPEFKKEPTTSIQTYDVIVTVSKDTKSSSVKFEETILAKVVETLNTPPALPTNTNKVEKLDTPPKMDDIAKDVQKDEDTYANKKAVYDAKVEFDKLNENYRDYTNENVTITYSPEVAKEATSQTQSYLVTVTFTSGTESKTSLFKEVVQYDVAKQQEDVDALKVLITSRELPSDLKGALIIFDPVQAKYPNEANQTYTVTATIVKGAAKAISTFEETVKYDEKLKIAFDVNSIKDAISSRVLPEDLKGTTVVFNPVSKKEATAEDQVYNVTVTITKGDSKATTIFEETIEANKDKKAVYDAKVAFDNLSSNHREYTNENVSISYDIESLKKSTVEDQSYQVTVTFKSGDETSVSTYNEFVKADEELVAQAILDKIAASITNRYIDTIDLNGASVVFDPEIKKEAISTKQTYDVTVTVSKDDKTSTRVFEEVVFAKVVETLNAPPALPTSTNKSEEKLNTPPKIDDISKDVSEDEDVYSNKKAVYDAKAEFDKLSYDYRDYTNENVTITYSPEVAKEATSQTQSYLVTVTFTSGTESKTSLFKEVVQYDVAKQQEDVDSIKAQITSRELPEDLKGSIVVFDPAQKKYPSDDEQTYTVIVKIYKGDAKAITTFEETVLAEQVQ
jgi:hypothetical protein